MAKKLRSAGDTIRDLGRNIAANVIFDVSRTQLYSFVATAFAVLFGSGLLTWLKASLPVAIVVVGFVGALVWIGVPLIMAAILGREVRLRSGIFHVSVNQSPRDKERNREIIEERVLAAGTVRILGATGFNTFARNDGEGRALLHETLETKPTIELQVALLHPKAHQALARARILCARNLLTRIDEYETETRLSIDFLKKLHGQGKRVFLKLYSQRPIWKLIFADNFLWLQQYPPDKHVEQMPVLGINRSEAGEFNLFDSFESVFRKKWEHEFNPEYDFDSQLIRYPDGQIVSLEEPPLNDLTSAPN